MLETGWIMKKATASSIPGCSANAPCCGHGPGAAAEKWHWSGYLGTIEIESLILHFERSRGERGEMIENGHCLGAKYFRLIPDMPEQSRTSYRSKVIPLLYGKFAHRTEISC
jgi:hypothetical protein